MKNKKEYIALGLLGAGAAATAIWLSSRISIPKGAKAVSPFNIDRYMGQWYEIARLDFKYEKGLDHVTANYSLKNDGSVKVDNKGFSVKEQQWKESIGKAKLAGERDEARLKVSFFGPFYAGYNVIAIDADYRYAMVAGNNLNYLWLLSRETTMPEAVKSTYLQQAEDLGYAIKNLNWTTQD